MKFAQDFCQLHDRTANDFIFNRFKCIFLPMYLVFKHFMKLEIDHLALSTMFDCSSHLILFHYFAESSTFFKKRK